MSENEKRERIEEIAKKFMKLDEEDKSYIAGYINGMQAERQRQERKNKQAAVATA